MMKKYVAKSCVSINIMLNSGKSKHIAFTPQSDGGSIYYTSSPAIQDALKRHYKYGSLFREEAVIPAAKPAAAASAATGTANGKKTVVVTDAEDAKNYLCEQFGYSRTKIRTLTAIREAAESKNIEFKGI